MTDDSKKRPLRLGEDPRDVLGDRKPPPHIAEQLAAPHEVKEDITGTYPSMPVEQREQVEVENSYRRLKRLSEQNDLLFKMNIEQSRAILDIAKATAGVHTKGLEASIRVAEKRATTELDDQAESHKWWRSTATQVIAGVIAAGGFVELLHRLQGC